MCLKLSEKGIFAHEETFKGNLTGSLAVSSYPALASKKSTKGFRTKLGRNIWQPFQFEDSEKIAPQNWIDMHFCAY